MHPYLRVFLILALLLPQPSDYPATAYRVADYLLAQQAASGAIPDEPGGDTVNMDSNMEYALIGLAAAYRSSGDIRYLTGLENGIRWLAGREDLSTTRWRGSWFYAYSPSGAHIAVSPDDPAILDVRGVDATSALFVYLLYLHAWASGSDSLAQEYAVHARAALDFVLDHNQSPDGFFYSSWQKWASDGQWHLWPFRYSADQADVYLGLRAGGVLYGEPRYWEAANRLRRTLPERFFDPAVQRYALGLDEDGSPENDLDGFNGIFPQGYLPWALGDHPQGRLAHAWLSACVQPDGSLACSPSDPRYSLSAGLYALSAAALALPAPTPSLNWLLATPFDPADGGVRDTASPASPKYPNVAGFTILALLQGPAFAPEQVRLYLPVVCDGFAPPSFMLQ